MPQPPNENLFDDSKMSFGQHLEELRGALFKAVIALAVGTLVGLLCANWVVKQIEAPLKEGLGRFYQNVSVEHYRTVLEQRIERNQPVPEELKDPETLGDDEKLLAAIKAHLHGEELMLPDEVYIDPHDILPALREEYPDTFDEIELPESNDENNVDIGRKSMIRVHLWRTIENDSRVGSNSMGAPEAFMIWIKAALVFGVVLSSPISCYFIWNFVAEGLYPHEKKYVHLYMPMSLGLFISGVALAYFVVIGFVLDFLFKFNASMDIVPTMRISEWMSFVLFLPIGFGLAFQLPLVMLFLERIGIASIQLYREKWRIAVLIIAFLSMILTPADPTSMIAMFVPLTVLYFGGILLCRFMPRSKSPFAEPIDD